MNVVIITREIYEEEEKKYVKYEVMCAGRVGELVCN